VLHPWPKTTILRGRPAGHITHTSRAPVPRRFTGGLAKAAGPQIRTPTATVIRRRRRPSARSNDPSGNPESVSRRQASTRATRSAREVDRHVGPTHLRAFGDESFTLHSSVRVTIAAVRVLVVEDEPKMGRLLERGFIEEGHIADIAPSGEEALRMAASRRYEAIVLDVMLPGLDGLATCRELRSRGVRTPVLLLTARDAFADLADGLDLGADDYLTKPFSFDELLARLGTLVRLAPGELPTTQLLDDLHVDPAVGSAWRGDAEREASTEGMT
jgi:CheY-like chemotaxis protein